MRIVLDLQCAQSDSRFNDCGRYSLALAQAIAREAKQHEVWIALNGRFPQSIRLLQEAFTNLIPPDRMCVFELPGPVAESDIANTWRMQAAELVREKFLTDLRPDLVHVSTIFEGFRNEVVASVARLEKNIPTAVTLYDLIPLLHSESLRDPAESRHYLRRKQSLKRADLVLTLSERSRREAVEILHLPMSRIANVGSGVRPLFRFQQVSSEGPAAFGLQRPFVLFTGGAEPHKNLEGLITAFAYLPAHLRENHQLAVTGILNHEERRRNTWLARKQGLKESDVIFLGPVTDEELRALYRACAVFAYPSQYESIDLSVREAMACGAPVIASECTGIAEIVDLDVAVFDPKQPFQIANCMATLLSDAELRSSLSQSNLEKSQSFTWEDSARAALRAFEILHAERNTALALKPQAHSRPLLAFVSPVPPERTGIAGYAARLLPELAAYYEITCIVDQPEVTGTQLTAEFAFKDARWFEANSERFERVVYQFGNSPPHKHMFGLLERHPGVAVLHDLFLGDILNWMAETGYAPGSFTKALYDSHGLSARKKDDPSRRESTITSFPCNAAVFRDSIGVVVHSNHAISMARDWYGDRAAACMQQIPFLPFAPEPTERAEARMRLGLPEKAFAVCSFGWITPMKLTDLLLEGWLGSPLGNDETCHLIIVGEKHSGEYGKRLSERIAGSEARSRIRVTGYVEASQYRDYMTAADLAVQLRTGSRGETSATIFDCLARKLPLIINAHGSAAELPDDVAAKLDDRFTVEALSALLARLHANTDLREQLAKSGALYVNEFHHPQRVAERYRDVIEEFYINSPRAREPKVLKAITRGPALTAPTDADLAAVAGALATNTERFGLPQILIDVSIVADFDLRTGIQRVTRAILMALIADPPPGYRIEPVRAIAGRYVYARHFAYQCLGLAADGLTDDPVEASRGDIFIGLDWCGGGIKHLRPWFLEQQRRGVQIIFLAYDMLPVRRPDYFPANMAPGAVDWTRTVTETADGVVCISRTVADELYEWLSETKPLRLRPISLGFFHLGADLHASLPTVGVSQDAAALLEKLRSRPSFLMVGTVEPRKGHRQVLAAMEELWTSGIDTNLVIVGKRGWIIDNLAERIQLHAEYNHRLFWLQGTSDEMLEEVYRSAAALLAASEGEGFGLPLIEAAQFGLPIVARDIAVFREVAGDHAYYFTGEEAHPLASALRQWLSLGGAAPKSAGIRWLTWQESSRQLLDVILGKRWYRFWPDKGAVDGLLSQIKHSRPKS